MYSHPQYGKKWTSFASTRSTPSSRSNWTRLRKTTYSFSTCPYTAIWTTCKSTASSTLSTPRPPSPKCVSTSTSTPSRSSSLRKSRTNCIYCSSECWTKSSGNFCSYTKGKTPPPSTLSSTTTHSHNQPSASPSSTKHSKNSPSSTTPCLTQSMLLNPISSSRTL